MTFNIVYEVSDVPLIQAKLTRIVKNHKEISSPSQPSNKINWDNVLIETERYLI